MPQEHHVVKCYKCETFQVQIVKKVNKFECKMCGEKQSVQKAYGRGSGKDCRIHVQKLRDLQIQNQSKTKENLEVWEPIEAEDIEDLPKVTNQNSKWSEFILKESSESDAPIDPKLSNYTFERPKKAIKRKRCNRDESQKITTNSNDDSFPKQSICNSNETDSSDDATNVSSSGSVEKKQDTSISKKSKWNNFIELENSDDSEKEILIRKEKNSFVQMENWDDREEEMNLDSLRVEQDLVGKNNGSALGCVNEEIEKVNFENKCIFSTNDDDLDDILDF